MVAFVITLLMTLLMAAGVKKSLVFNNVLNAVNLAVWVFVMSAGLFYVDSKNWTEHKGFLPYGWSGVSESAETRGPPRLAPCPRPERPEPSPRDADGVPGWPRALGFAA